MRAFEQERPYPNGRHRNRSHRPDGDEHFADTPFHHRGQYGRRRRHPHEVPLSGLAPRGGPQEPGAAPSHDDGGAPLFGQPGILGNRDPDAGGLHPGRRKGLSCPKPHFQRFLLCPSPVAAALQAAFDGRRRRSLFPTRPLLSRRGPARGQTAGIHADRL